MMVVLLSGCSLGNKKIVCSMDMEDTDVYETAKTSFEINYGKNKKVTTIVQKAEMVLDKSNEDVKENFDTFEEQFEEAYLGEYKENKDKYKGVDFDIDTNKKNYSVVITITYDINKMSDEIFDSFEFGEFFDEERNFDEDAFWESYEDIKDSEDSYKCVEK